MARHIPTTTSNAPLSLQPSPPAAEGATYLGTVVDGRYRMQEQLGAGAMGQVFKVQEVGTDRVLALKVMSTESSVDPSLVRRFKREYDACRQCEHRNVVRLHGFGQLPDGCSYYVMDYLPFPSLASLLENRRRLPELEALALLLQVADGLEAIHARGVLHRDLKPGNLIVTNQGRLVIVDFGVAHADLGTKLTATGTVVGTPFYLAPELLRSQKATAAADLYAVGAIAYELLRGTPPFDAPSLGALFLTVLSEPHVPLAEVVPGLAPGWDPFIARCLAKDPKDRYATAADLRRGLLTVRDSLGSSPASRTVAAAPSTETSVPAALPQTVAPRRRSLLAPAAAGVLALLALLLSLPAARPTAHDLRIDDGGDALVVRWSSDAPYPSRVRLDGPSPRTYEGDGAAPVTSHAVTIGPLPSSSNHTFRILFPDGTMSLPQKAGLAPLALEALGATESADGVELGWRCRTGAEAFVTARAPGEPRATWPARRLDDGRWSALLTKLSPGTDELAVSVRLAAGTTRVFDLGEALLGEVDQSVRTIADVAVSGSMEPALEAAWDRLVSSSRLAFGTALLPATRKAEAYRAVVKVLKLERYASLKKASPPWRLDRRPWLGEYATPAAPSPAPDLTLALPIERPPALLALPNMSFYEGDPTFLRLKVRLERRPPPAQAELVLETGSVHRMALEVRVNGRTAAWILDGREVPKDGPSITLVQRLPVAAFQEGDNVLELLPRHMFDEKTWQATRVAAARLALWYAR